MCEETPQCRGSAVPGSARVGLTGGGGGGVDLECSCIRGGGVGTDLSGWPDLSLKDFFLEIFFGNWAACRSVELFPAYKIVVRAAVFCFLVYFDIVNHSSLQWLMCEMYAKLAFTHALNCSGNMTM